MVAVGRRILPKAELIDEASNCLQLLSGRTHRVYTGVCSSPPSGKLRQRLVETRVRFKRLSSEEMESLSGLRRMARQGRRLCHPGDCRHLRRQARRLLYRVVGLPLYETVALLTAEGYRLHFKWLAAHG